MIEPNEPVYYSDEIDPVRRSSPDEVFWPATRDFSH
jgi:hypothetical protein